MKGWVDGRLHHGYSPAPPAPPVWAATCQAVASDELERKCGAVLESTMEAHQALKSKLTAQVGALEDESSEMLKRHETVAADVKKYLEHLMAGVAGLTAWREGATVGLRELREKVDEAAGVAAAAEAQRAEERKRDAVERATERDALLRQVRELHEVQQEQAQAGAAAARGLADVRDTQARRDAELAALAQEVAEDRKSTRLNSSHITLSRMPSSA